MSLTLKRKEMPLASGLPPPSTPIKIASSMKKKGHTYHTLTVFLENGAVQQVEYGAHATCKDLVALVCQKCNLKDTAALFALVIVDVLGKEDDVVLHPDKRVASIITDISRPGEWLVYLKFQYLPYDLASFAQQQPEVMGYLFQQIATRFLAGGYRKMIDDVGTYKKLSEERIIRTGCVHMRYQLVSMRPDLEQAGAIKEKNILTLEKEIGFNKFIPDEVLNLQKKRKALMATITANLKDVEKLNKLQCMQRYVEDVAQDIPEIFSPRFPIQGIADSVVRKGLLIFNPAAKTVIFDSGGKTKTELCTFSNLLSLDLNGDSVDIRFLQVNGAAKSLKVQVLGGKVRAECLCSIAEGFFRTVQPTRTLIASAEASAGGDLDTFVGGVDTVHTFIETLSVKWHIDREQVKLISEIGHGQFGKVYKGVLTLEGDRTVRVAVKAMIEGSEEQRDLFIQEAKSLEVFQHPHIVKLFGMVLAESPLIVMELMILGEMRSFLQTNELLLRGTHLPMTYCWQLASALSYVSSLGYVHRDIAARNILVYSPDTIKLADFGMAMKIDEVYIVQDGKMPIKWLAPETICFRRHTFKSDVWMYAVCCWEMLMYGVKPFVAVQNENLVALLESGERLPAPHGCPPELYQLWLRCWCFESQGRPSFDEVCDATRKIIDKLRGGLRNPDLKAMEESSRKRPEATSIRAHPNKPVSSPLSSSPFNPPFTPPSAAPEDLSPRNPFRLDAPPIPARDGRPQFRSVSPSLNPFKMEPRTADPFAGPAAPPPPPPAELPKRTRPPGRKNVFADDMDIVSSQAPTARPSMAVSEPGFVMASDSPAAWGFADSRPASSAAVAAAKGDPFGVHHMSVSKMEDVHRSSSPFFEDNFERSASCPAPILRPVEIVRPQPLHPVPESPEAPPPPVPPPRAANPFAPAVFLAPQAAAPAAVEPEHEAVAAVQQKVEEVLSLGAGGSAKGGEGSEDQMDVSVISMRAMSAEADDDKGIEAVAGELEAEARMEKKKADPTAHMTLCISEVLKDVLVLKGMSPDCNHSVYEPYVNQIIRAFNRAIDATRALLPSMTDKPHKERVISAMKNVVHPLKALVRAMTFAIQRQESEAEHYKHKSEMLEAAKQLAIQCISLNDVMHKGALNYGLLRPAGAVNTISPQKRASMRELNPNM